MRDIFRVFAAAIPGTMLLAGCDNGSTTSSDPASSTGANPDRTFGSARDFGVPWNTKISYGTLVDSRDGKTYRTVKVGSQTWMAQNLDWAGAGGVGTCTHAIPDSCEKYGRLYTWIEAMDAQAPSATIPSGVRGICPAGWHIPSYGEWTQLETLAETNVGKWTAGIGLKSNGGWSSGKGYDLYGLRMLPAGWKDDHDLLNDVGSRTFLLSSNASGSDFLCEIFRADLDRADGGEERKTYGSSLRCVQDP